jgi:putative FmdB family regulatory protein
VPIYDYVCGVCRHRFEVFHGLNEAGPHQCPACGGSVSRAFAPPTIVFKGSGWAKVDRRATRSAASRSRGTEGGAEGTGSAGDPAAPADERPGPAAATAPPASPAAGSDG